MSKCPVTQEPRVVRVRSFELPGMECVFLLADHDPPHFHAKRRGHWEVRAFFLEERERMLELKWCRKTLTGKDRRTLCDAAESHGEELLEQWEETRPQPDDRHL
jgi:hypothetical protein